MGAACPRIGWGRGETPQIMPGRRGANLRLWRDDGTAGTPPPLGCAWGSPTPSPLSRVCTQAAAARPLIRVAPISARLRAAEHKPPLGGWKTAKRTLPWLLWTNKHPQICCPHRRCFGITPGEPRGSRCCVASGKRDGGWEGEDVGGPQNLAGVRDVGLQAPHLEFIFGMQGLLGFRLGMEYGHCIHQVWGGDLGTLTSSSGSGYGGLPAC